MKVFNKLLIASTMVLALGATTSCGNKPTNTTATGSPYTIIYVSCYNIAAESLTITFDCEGEPTTYWGDGTLNNEKSHTFTSDDNGSFYYDIFISGNIKSLKFANKDGLLSEDNIWIEEVTFSNTITHLPEYSFLLPNLHFLYIPSNVTTIGDYAFPDTLADSCECIFEPVSRPSGWSTQWCTPYLEVSSIWGVGFYVNENDEYISSYLLFNAKSGTNGEAFYVGPLLNIIDPSSKPITKIDNIPESIVVNNRTYSITGIESVEGARLTLKTVTIPKTVKYILYGAFEECIKLETVNFAPNSDLRVIQDVAFSGCDSLKSIVLPNKVEKLSYGAFGGSTPLESLVIPNSVRTIATDVIGSYIDHPTVTVDITAYQDAKEIAFCKDDAFYYCKKATFVYDSSKLSPDNFYERNWPKEETGKIIWQPKSSLSI